jgi:hypothetical protein
MDYIIQGSPSRARRPEIPSPFWFDQQQSSRNAQSRVFFASQFEAAEVPARRVRAYCIDAFDEIIGQDGARITLPIVRDANVVREQQGQAIVHATLDDIEVQTGSIEIILLVENLRVELSSTHLPIILSVAAGLGTWTADKLFGGVVGRVGEMITERVASKLPAPDTGRVPVRSIDAIAEQEANAAALSRGCKLAISQGGFREGDWYRYRYDLLDCTKQVVEVHVHKSGIEPNRVRVWP